MADSAYKRIGEGKVTGRTSPYKIPSKFPFGTGDKGAAGKLIPSHPFYKHRLNTKYMKKRDRASYLGGSRRKYTKPAYPGLEESGLTSDQWDAITVGRGGSLTELPDALTGLAGVHGKKWYSQKDIDPATGLPAEGAAGYGGRSVHEQLNYSDYWKGVYEGGGYGYPSWAKGWYEPARELGVESQLGVMQEVGSEAETFREASAAGVPISTTPGDYGFENIPQTGAPISKGVEQPLAGLPGQLAGAEANLQTELGTIYGGPGGEGSLARLETEKKLALEQLKGARLGVAEQRLPAMERAQAQRASTGMAFSGPAERAIKYGQQELLGNLAEISKQERDVKRQYGEDVLAEEETARGYQKAFSGTGGAVESYWDQMADIFGQARTAAEDVTIQGEDLLNAWADFGDVSGFGGVPLTNIGEHGMGYSGGAFQELVTGGYSPWEEFQVGVPQTAQDFASNLVSQALDRISQLDPSPDVGEEWTGGA
jgi:hypothetical protein